MRRSECYRILGISEGASKTDVKRAYRRLAKRYHPDKNVGPLAAKKFIAINEAYETLLENKVEASSVSTQKSKKEARYQEAKMRFERRERKEQLEQEAFFVDISSGVRYARLKKIVLVSCVLAFLFAIDGAIPGKIVTDKITRMDVSGTKQGLHYPEVLEVEFQHLGRVWVSADVVYQAQNRNQAELEISRIFKDVKEVVLYSNEGQLISRADYSFQGAFPAPSIILIFPLSIFLFKSRTPLYSFLFYLVYYGYSALIVFLLLSNYRFLHVFGL